MSKAFTREDAPEPPLERPRASGSRVITPEGHAALVAELQSASPERAAVLAQILDGLQVVPAGPDDGVVRFGSRVHVRDESGDRELRLVGPDEAHPPDLVSIDSPLARALLGRTAGESVTVDRPRGPLELDVVSVHN